MKDVIEGYVFYAPWNENYKWKVIDDKNLGVWERYKNEEDAKRAARNLETRWWSYKNLNVNWKECVKREKIRDRDTI